MLAAEESFGHQFSMHAAHSMSPISTGVSGCCTIPPVGLDLVLNQLYHSYLKAEVISVPQLGPTLFPPYPPPAPGFQQLQFIRHDQPDTVS